MNLISVGSLKKGRKFLGVWAGLMMGWDWDSKVDKFNNNKLVF